MMIVNFQLLICLYYQWIYMREERFEVLYPADY